MSFVSGAKRPSWFLLFYIRDPELLQLVSKAIEVEPELALAQPLARLLLLRHAVLRGLRHLCRVLPRHHDNAIDVANDTSVPVGFLLTSTLSPGRMCCKREVSGPSGTLML